MEGFVRLIHAPLGYDPHNVMSVGIPIHANSYTTWAARAAYFEQLRAKVAETPGVTMTAISSNATPPRNGWNLRFEILGQTCGRRPVGLTQFSQPTILCGAAHSFAARAEYGMKRRIKTALMLW